MNDKERTNYFRKKLQDLKETADIDPLGNLKEDKSPGSTSSSEQKTLSSFSVTFKFVYSYLVCYGAQYIVIKNFINPSLVLNFFETGIIFLFLSMILKNRS